MDSWSTICIKNARDMALSCIRNPEAFVSSLVKFGSVRGTLLMFYAEAMARKEIESLYVQPVETKLFYWRQAQRDSGGRLTEKQLIDLSKALYYTDFLLSKYGQSS